MKENMLKKNLEKLADATFIKAFQAMDGVEKLITVMSANVAVMGIINTFAGIKEVSNGHIIKGAARIGLGNVAIYSGISTVREMMEDSNAGKDAVVSAVSRVVENVTDAVEEIGDSVNEFADAVQDKLDNN